MDVSYVSVKVQKRFARAKSRCIKSQHDQLVNAMRYKTIFIHWHMKGAPILSVTLNANGKLVTGGGDNYIRVCKIIYLI